MGAGDVVLDLGCGYGEFINQVRCREKFAMDLNPDAPRHLNPDVQFLLQDCSARWQLPDGSLDVVFTSNFFEHLPDKPALGRTLDEIHRCLRPGGRLVAMGPNVKHVPGAYWDFWDHHIALTEASLSEALRTRGFDIDVCIDRFLPYTMATGRQYPMAFLRAYLKLPLPGASSASNSWSSGSGVKEADVLSVVIVNYLRLRSAGRTASNRSRRSCAPADVVVVDHQTQRADRFDRLADAIPGGAVHPG